jgi:hypothetical protein
VRLCPLSFVRLLVGLASRALRTSANQLSFHVVVYGDFGVTKATYISVGGGF